MTERKPDDVSFGDWVEQQIRRGQEEGKFDHLPGSGKPIPGLDRRQRDLDWAAKWVRRQNVDVCALLPPALALAKEVEDLHQRLSKVRSETRVRAIVEDLNTRIRAAHRAPQLGPPVRAKVVDVEAAVAAWRADRADS